ncbi:MAG TPA: DUF72 domain-containing protein [Chloroflexota bacterium]|nr:DUF72 domain-containing protein [Chloroflexota bacterium]
MMNPETASKIRVGTCNWADHTDFYPATVKANERLTYYARHFSLVEVDSTFYHLQPAHNFARWAERTPADFVFDVKAYRELTWHDRGTEPSAETFERFGASLRPLQDARKLRAVLFQFPPWFTFQQKNREYLSTCKEFFPDQTLAVEFRHRSWLTPENRDDTLALLRDQQLAHVMVDEPQIGSGSVPAVVAATSAALAIVRFHGRNRQTWYAKVETTGERFNYLYQQQELSEWLPSLEGVAAQTGEVHVLLNNNRANYAVRNAKDFQMLLGQRVVPFESEQTPTLL